MLDGGRSHGAVGAAEAAPLLPGGDRHASSSGTATTGAPTQMKAREFDGSTCLEVYLVHFEWVA